MLLNLFDNANEETFVVIDPVFPQKEPFAFRNTEINEYFKILKNFSSYTMSTMQPGQDAWFTHSYGMSRKDFLVNKRGYLKHYPKNKKRIHYLDEKKQHTFKLAYSFFLAETYTLLPFLEKNKIPFVFVLYPGGGFGIENQKSDKMLKRIFQSPYFRHVIATQQIAFDYLIDKTLCSIKNISYIYGGFVQFKKTEVKKKKYYKKDKSTFDICFVAAKYSEKGVDKGYDLFIDVAKKLSKLTDDIRFHVVGGYNVNDIEVKDILNKLKFYGYKTPDFLIDFYSKMDIFLSPNRPFKLYKGNFDGFPLGIDAGYCGVALFVTDRLKLNRYYIEGQEIVIIQDNTREVVSTILDHHSDYRKLYKLADKGRIKTQTLFDIDYQINERVKVFSKYVNLEWINS